MSNGWSKDSNDVDRLGQMHARRHSLNVTRTLNAKLRGFGPRVYAKQQARKNKPASARSAARASRAIPASLRQQRVIVKAHVPRHFAGKTPQALRSHVRYLARPAASLDGQPGKFYNADQVGIDAQDHVQAWVNDRHHFRIVISPENAHQMQDMTGYVREVMRRVERDLKTELNWIAINHTNTDNNHTHVMIRGKRDNGQDLRIPKQYISYDFRTQAQEVATLWLGERTVSEIQQAKDREVNAMRWTSLDRFMQQRLIEIPEQPAWKTLDLVAIESFGDVDPELPRRIKGRLHTLEQLALATPGKKKTWYVQTDFRQTLTGISEREDIIKQLYPSMGISTNQVELWHRQYDASQEPQPLQGVVLAKGRVDEISGQRWLVLQNVSGTKHYIRAQQSDVYDQLSVGSVAEIGRDAHTNHLRSQEIIAVARENNGLYSAKLHTDDLRAHESKLPDWQRSLKVRSAVGYASFIAGHTHTGITVSEDSQKQESATNTVDPQDARRAVFARTYKVDAPLLDTYSRRMPSGFDLHFVTLYPIEQQVQAQAVTWLDRLMIQNPAIMGADQKLAHEVQAAIRQRQEWLINQGLAHQEADGKFVLAHNALATLAQREKQHQQQIHERLQKPALFVQEGQSAEGIYRGLRPMHEGQAAVVESDHNVALVHVRQPLRNVEVGHQVAIQIYRGGQVWAQDLTVQNRQQELDLFSKWDREQGVV